MGKPVKSGEFCTYRDGTERAIGIVVGTSSNEYTEADGSTHSKDYVEIAKIATHLYEAEDVAPFGESLDPEPGRVTGSSSETAKGMGMGRNDPANSRNDARNDTRTDVRNDDLRDALRDDRNQDDRSDTDPRNRPNNDPSLATGFGGQGR